MLEVRDLHVYYGGIHALHGISLRVPDGQIVALLGANGAGKSTTLRTIAGIVKPSEGDVLLDGESLIGLRSFEVVRRGIAMVPEGRRVFTNLTVLENLRLGAYARRDSNQVIQRDLQEIFNLFPRLEERKKQSAGTLSGGEQQMLALGRALMSKPRILMIDEPSLGLAPVLAQDVFEKLKELNQAGQTILLIEQNARAAMSIANYAYILETGNIVLEGPAAELAQQDEVRKSYLGVH
ncbi:MAG: ABC transporter ATP-binding protein [Chloroflexi bacterium]|nr:ABC transporter ATP-binding protein [Anaerolineae bacterium]RLC73587.1 MAG: ABC transporter ATP-binding protein [Chloroflexota bacterium]